MMWSSKTTQPHFLSIKRDYSPPPVDQTSESACSVWLVFLCCICVISQPSVSPQKCFQIFYQCVLVLFSECGVVLPYHKEITVSEMFYYIARLQFCSYLFWCEIESKTPSWEEKACGDLPKVILTIKYTGIHTQLCELRM